jgi:uncharacterized membrane protein YfcA
MLPNFEDYCQRLRAEADSLAAEAEEAARLNHVHVFNFGRSVAHLEHRHDAFWLRLRWLLLGAAVGVTLAAAYLQVFLSNRILQFTK